MEYTRTDKAPRGSQSAEECGKKIEAFLYRNNMSTREAARRCGLPQSSMQAYRRGITRPSARAMLKLQAIGLTESYVYGPLAERDVAERAKDDLAIEKFLSLPDEDRAAVRAFIEDLATTLSN